MSYQNTRHNPVFCLVPKIVTKTTMPRNLIDPTVEGEVRAFLGLGWSYGKIISELKKKNMKVSKGTIHNIKNRDRIAMPLKEIQRKSGADFKKMNQNSIKKLKNMVTKDNPKTQKQLATSFKCTQQNISYHINKTLNLKKKNKNFVHRLSDQNIENRRRRSLKLYKILNNQKWRKMVTTDEAWFYVNDFDGKRKIQYVSRDSTQARINLTICRKERFSAGFMVWAGISARGKTSLHFVSPGAKIDSKYYIDNVLKKFISRDLQRLYPDGKFTLHQDSAPSHRSKMTLEFLKSSKINFITPEEWIPKSPDAAPMDYFVWGFLKNRLRKKNIKDTADLKRQLKREWKSLPQELIDRALESWPKRVYKIYQAKGNHIE